MLIPRRARGERRNRHGSRNASFAELQRLLAEPSSLNDRHRQRLLDFVERVARVRALGDEYAGIELSQYVTAATERNAVLV